jgi:tryptophan-rich sensory protein
MGKLYSDSLYKYKDSEKTQSEVEIKLPVNENNILNFFKVGVMALIALLISLALLKILFHSSQSLSSVVLIYGYIIIVIFLLAIGSPGVANGPGIVIAQGTGKYSRGSTFDIQRNKTYNKKRPTYLPKPSQRVFSIWMILYGTIMVLFVEGVISF